MGGLTWHSPQASVFTSCLVALWIGGYFDSVDKDWWGLGEDEYNKRGAWKDIGWLFVWPIVVRTLGKQRECLKRDINSLGAVVVWLKQVQYICLPAGLVKSCLACFIFCLSHSVQNALAFLVFQGSMYAVNITNLWKTSNRSLAQLEIVFRC